MKTIVETGKYTDLPLALGEVVAEYRIEPGSAIAYTVKKNQLFRLLMSMVLNAPIGSLLMLRI